MSYDDDDKDPEDVDAHPDGDVVLPSDADDDDGADEADSSED